MRKQLLDANVQEVRERNPPHIHVLHPSYIILNRIQSFIITDSDYLNGIGDLTGELMRYAINSIGAGHHDAAISVCHVMQEIHKGLTSEWRAYTKGVIQSVNTIYAAHLLEFEIISAISPGIVAKKLETMKASLTKVEQGKPRSERH